MKICLVCGAEFSPKRACGKKQLYCGIGCRKLAKKENDDKCKRAYEDAHREEINAKRMTKYKEASPEEVEARKRYHNERYNNNEEHRAKVRACDLKSRLGTTIEEYESRREAQRVAGDLCGLCKQPLGEKTAHLDHDHDSNQLREFLHSNCNLAIGLLKDSSQMCRMAAEYLERHGR
jgi:hypothetical protein